jgi:hypothetical protein
VISLEQVRALESRVEKALAYIARLRSENEGLARKAAECQAFVDEVAEELGAAEASRDSAIEGAAASEARAAVSEARSAELEAEAAELRSRVAELQARSAELQERSAELQEHSAELEARSAEVEARAAREAARIASIEARAVTAESQIAELVAKADEYRRDQSRIEEGIVHALEKLDFFEDLVLSQPLPDAQPGPEAPAPAGELAVSGTVSPESEATTPASAATEPTRAPAATKPTGVMSSARRESSGIEVKAAPVESDSPAPTPANRASGEAELDIF